MKKTFQFIAVAICFALATACSNKRAEEVARKKSEIQQFVDKMQSGLPIEVEAGLVWNSLEYDPETLTVSYNFTFTHYNNEEWRDKSQEIKKSSSARKKYISTTIFNDEELCNFYQNLSDIDGKLEFIYRNHSTDDTCTLTYTAQDLRDIMEYVEASSDPHQRLSYICEYGNSCYPKEIDGDDLKITAVKLYENFITVYCDYNEDEYSLRAITDLHSLMLDSARDEVQKYKELMKELNIGYRLVFSNGNPSEDITLEYSVSELFD